MDEGINGLSGYYDVLMHYRGAEVRILLRQHPAQPCIGTVAWVGAHIVQLSTRGESQWVFISEIAAIATPDYEEWEPQDPKEA